MRGGARNLTLPYQLHGRSRRYGRSAAGAGRGAGGDSIAGGAPALRAELHRVSLPCLAASADAARAACAQTTIMAVTYDGGVVLGADSRTSTGASASLPSCRFRRPCTGTPAASCCRDSRADAAWPTRRACAVRRLTRRPRWRAGSYVANRVADKISMLAENVYICRSGSVRARCASSYTRASALVFAAAAVLLALQPLLGRNPNEFLRCARVPGG